tara:strand:+ start:102 stop:647 length:546 start_codon:yes stop_codon:yes gene_type:complete
MKKLIFLIIFLIINTSVKAVENWEIEMILDNKFISVSTHGTITHGDKYRLLFNLKGDCSSVEETFTFYTMANHPKILKIKNKKIAYKYNGKNKLSNITSSSKFLGGHIVFISSGLHNVEDLIGLLENRDNLEVNLVGVIDNIKKKTGWSSEKMFDINFNSWSLNNFSKSLKKGQSMCLENK